MILTAFSVGLTLKLNPYHMLLAIICISHVQGQPPVNLQMQIVQCPSVARTSSNKKEREKITV